MSAFTAVDLSQLPVPDVVEDLSFEAILTAMKADLIQRDPSLSDVLQIESEPLVKQLEVSAYREVIIRQRVNEAAKAVMLAYAMKSDLDHRGSAFNVARLLISPGDPDAIPPVDSVYENDEDFRRRIQLSLEGFSTAGPEGAYIFHALGADGQVKDASADAPRFSYAVLDPGVQAQLPANTICLQVDYDAGLASPMPGDVVVSVLGRDGDGTAVQAVLDAVDLVLSSEDVRPLTDQVHVQSANITSYSIDATLHFFAGPDRTVVMQEAQAELDKYTQNQHRMGLDITLSGIYAALHRPGVQRVVLTSPAADVVVDRQGAAYCTGSTLTDGGLDE